MNQESLYWENGHPTKINVEIQCNSNKNTQNILHRNQENQKIYTEPEKTSDK